MTMRDLLCGTMLALLMLQPSGVAATNYRLDPTETISSFEVWLLGVIPVRGHFKRTTGDMRFDPASRVGSVEVLIDTTSVEANSARANAAARGADFFNVEKYPRIAFKSSRFVFEGERLHLIEGMLTLTGNTQPVTLAIHHAVCKPAPAVCRAEATLTVKRSAFGMRSWSHAVGDDVTINIAMVAFAEPDDTKPQPLPSTVVSESGAPITRPQSATHN